MDNTVQDILKILLSNGILVGLWYLNKPKQKAETESIVTQQYNALDSTKTAEIKRLNEKADANEKAVRSLEASLQEQRHINQLQQRENEECKMTSSALKLQVKRLKRLADFQGYEWEKVYVLDDNPMVTLSFEKHFRDADILMAAFNEPNAFMEDVIEHQPPVLIIDNHLGETEAEALISKIHYQPKIIIFSMDHTVKTKFADRGIEFFPKSEQYILKIAQTVIEYLSNTIT